MPGPGIIATDMSEQSGLKLVQFSEDTVKELKKYLPSNTNFHNPVDVIGMHQKTVMKIF
jgi:acetate---CoA ligase (ADP-forming)